jgi:hypothetical protein
MFRKKPLSNDPTTGTSNAQNDEPVYSVADTLEAIAIIDAKRHRLRHEHGELEREELARIERDTAKEAAMQVLMVRVLEAIDGCADPNGCTFAEVCRTATKKTRREAVNRLLAEGIIEKVDAKGCDGLNDRLRRRWMR